MFVRHRSDCWLTEDRRYGARAFFFSFISRPCMCEKREKRKRCWNDEAVINFIHTPQIEDFRSAINAPCRITLLFFCLMSRVRYGGYWGKKGCEAATATETITKLNPRSKWVGAADAYSKIHSVSGWAAFVISKAHNGRCVCVCGVAAAPPSVTIANGPGVSNISTMQFN